MPIAAKWIAGLPACPGPLDRLGPPDGAGGRNDHERGQPRSLRAAFPARSAFQCWNPGHPAHRLGSGCRPGSRGALDRSRPSSGVPGGMPGRSVRSRHEPGSQVRPRGGESAAGADHNCARANDQSPPGSSSGGDRPLRPCDWPPAGQFAASMGQVAYLMAAASRLCPSARRHPLALPFAPAREAGENPVAVGLVVPGGGNPGQGDVSRGLDRRG